jgi:hypothetical protein
VRRVASQFDRCPDKLAASELTAYCCALIDSYSWSTVEVDRNDLQFFYRHVVEREWILFVRPLWTISESVL